MKINGKTYFTTPLIQLSEKTIRKHLLPLTSPQSSCMRDIIYDELFYKKIRKHRAIKQIAVVAKDKDEYIGWGLITIYSKKESRYQVYVKPKYRRQKIGTELAKRMESYLKRKGIDTYQVEPRNLRESARFFKSLGFSPKNWLKTNISV